MITIHCLRSGRFSSYFILVYACTATDMLCWVLNCLVVVFFCCFLFLFFLTVLFRFCFVHFLSGKKDSIFQKTKNLRLAVDGA